MKQTLPRFLLSILLVSVLAGMAQASPSATWVEGEVLVRYHESAAQLTSERAERVHGLRTVRVIRSHTRRGPREIRLLRSERLSTIELMEVLRQDPSVDVVEPNVRMRPQVTIPDDPRFGDLWGLSRIGAPEAWDTTTGNAGVVVAVLDSGIDYTHDDLAGNMWTTPGAGACTGLTAEETAWVTNGIHGYDFAANDDGDDDADPMDIDGHGTHVAGTIAAVGNNANGVVGVTWNASIIAVKAQRPDGFLYRDDQLQAMDYIRTLREKCNVNIVAVNASYGGANSGSEIVRAAIDRLGDAGVIFVASAGNNTSDNDTVEFHPANYDLPNVLSVASINDADQLSSFSNFGLNKVDLAAPGSAILSTDLPSRGTGLVSHAGNDYSATVFTFSPSIPLPITAQAVHCGLAQLATDCPAEVAGNIALIERGEVNFSVKAENAKTAGAVAVVIYNSVAGGEDMINGTLGEAGDWLPTLGIPRSVGILLRDLGSPQITVRTAGGYSIRGGTSMAAPHVTGALALLATQHPADTMEERIARLLAAIEPLPALQDTVRTGGLLNLRNLFADPVTQPPIRPGNLFATPSSSTEVMLEWVNQSPYTASFVIERRVGTGAFTEVATVGSGITQLAQAGLDLSQTHTWRVRAIGPAGPSAWSNNAVLNAPLASGSVVNGTIAQGQFLHYSVLADAQRRRVWARLDQMNADGDLYLRKGQQATLASYDCRPFLAGDAAETCEAANNSGPNLWFVGVHGAEATDYRLRVWLTPYTPSGVTATVLTGRRIRLQWSVDSGDETEVRIERRIGAVGGFQPLISLPHGTTEHIDQGLSEGSEYFYRVVAANPAGDSFFSTTASATAIDTAVTAPTAPSALVVVPTSPNALTLSWTDNADNEVGYRVERRSGAGSFEEVAVLDVNSESYTDSGLPAGAYTYRVLAFNVVGSASSNEVTATAFDAIQAVDNAGVAQDGFDAVAGSGLFFTVGGGSGNFAVTALPNQSSGTLATLIASGNGWLFTAPTSGAFAGTYILVVDDLSTGWSRNFDVEVPLAVTLGPNTLRSEFDEAEVVVRGASPGVTPDYRSVIDGSLITGNLTFVSSVASIDDAAADGNPASAVIRAPDGGASVTAQLQFDATVGALQGVSNTVELVRSCSIDGTVTDVFGNRLTGVRIASPLFPGPAGMPWELFTDTNGEYGGRLPFATPASPLLATLTGFASKSIHVCGAGQQVNLDLADFVLRLTVQPMFQGETVTVRLDYASTGIAGHTMGSGVASASGAALIELGLDSRIQYTQMRVTAPGYITLDDDNSGMGWGSTAGMNIDHEVEIVPQSPVVTPVEFPGPAGSQTTRAVRSSVETNLRETRFWFEYRAQNAPSFLTTAERFFNSGPNQDDTVNETLGGLSCGTAYEVRAVAENDWGLRMMSVLATFMTGACPSPPAPPPAGGGGGGRLNPWVLVFLGWLGWLAVRRRAIHAYA